MEWKFWTADVSIAQDNDPSVTPRRSSFIVSLNYFYFSFALSDLLLSD